MWKNIVGIVAIQFLLVVVLSNIGVSTFISGLFFSAIICGVSALLYTKIKPTKIRYFFIFVSPFYISYSLYWLPVSSNGSNAEYSAWELIFVVPCFIVGLVSSIVVYYLSAKSNMNN